MANSSRFWFAILSCYCIVAVLSQAAAAPSSIGKVNVALLKSFESKNRLNIFVSMREGTSKPLETIALNKYASRGDQATAVFNTLNSNAFRSQKSVLEMLNSPKFFTFKIQSFWITNQIYVQGADLALIEALAAFDEVSSIDEEEIVHLDNRFSISHPSPEDPSVNAEWGIDKIKAEEAWRESGNGAGAVVGIIDSGARYTHEAIRGSYLGGTRSWFNPYSNTQNPTDGYGHGTHVTGTIAGIGGIGVAPGAKWISCKALRDDGTGSQAALIACGEFMACPHTYDGQNRDCNFAPHVVSNSWGTPSFGYTWFNEVIRAWHAGNIIPVFSNGNNGERGCGTSGSPADSAAGVIGVGATTTTDAIAPFSSLGPSRFDQLKPDISAPGVDVRSAGILSDNDYLTASGTSMACPHVAGLVALLKSKIPTATFNMIKEIMQSTADKNLSFGTLSCGGISERVFPNHVFGHGRINVLAAVRAANKY